MIEKTVIIMRAWPGCGKSTLARAIVESLTSGDDYHDILGVRVCSADSFHVDKDGVYRWSFERSRLGHDYCRGKFSQAVISNCSLIIVDNTNIKRKDYGWYVANARAMGYKVYQAIPETPWMHSVDECFKRNVHNVPLDTIQRMMASFEYDNELERFNLSDEWKARLPTLAAFGASG